MLIILSLQIHVNFEDKNELEFEEIKGENDIEPKTERPLMERG